MMHQTTILVVDDDPGLIRFLGDVINSEGWKYETALDGQEAIEKANQQLPDLIILDILLPKIDGLEVFHKLRDFCSVPIIMLSGKTEISEKIKFLKLGADDYITKPFAVGEFIERIKNILRRSYSNEELCSPVRLAGDSLQIDFNAKQVTVRGQETKLTPTEYKLLLELATNEGKTLSHEYLLKTIWGSEYRMEREYLHVYIRHLRAKIELDPQNPRYITSVPGMGYVFKSSP